MSVSKLPANFSEIRRRRLRRELKIALENSSKSDLSAWGIRSGRVLVGAGIRRFRNIGKLLAKGYEVVVGEKTKFQESESASKYVSSRSKDLSESAKSIPSSAAGLWKKAANYTRTNPKKAASQIALLCLGFGVGSGGPDGDGGIPDLDWTHRHSQVRCQQRGLDHGLLPRG